MHAVLFGLDTLGELCTLIRYDRKMICVRLLRRIDIWSYVLVRAFRIYVIIDTCLTQLFSYDLVSLQVFNTEPARDRNRIRHRFAPERLRPKSYH